MREHSACPEIFIPQFETDTGMRATHLGIGAHQDDLEFMAFHGIMRPSHLENRSSPIPISQKTS